MTDLPDVNVWLALADENHLHHPRAVAYWQNEAAPTIAFCRVTMLGFLRLATHPKGLTYPLTNVAAWELLDRYRNEPGVGLIDDSWESEKEFRLISSAPDFPHHLWTDAYLASLARLTDSRVVSFDNDFKRFDNLDFLQL